MKSSLIILGCGSSIGVPRIDGYWGKCKKSEKKNYRKRVEVKVPPTHYVEGDIKHFYDPNWKLLMQNI